MLAGALTLWDIQWGQAATVPASDKSDVFVPKETVERAFGLLELLNGIEAVMSQKIDKGSNCYSDATEPVQASSSNEDCNYDPAISQQTGLKDTELARRVLLRLKPHQTAEDDITQGDMQEYAVDRHDAYKIINTKEAKDGKKNPSASEFRSFGEKFKTLGLGFCRGEKWIVRWPTTETSQEDQEAFADSLNKFANVSIKTLQDAIEKKN